MKQLEQSILDYVSRPGYKPLKPDALAAKLKLSKKKLPAFRKTIGRLVAEGRLIEGKKERLRPRAAAGLVAGIIKRTRSGPGFLIPHEPVQDGASRDVFIAPEDLRDAHTGDEALVRLLKTRGRGGRRTGRVEEILVRATNTFVGTYLEREGQGYVQVDGTTFHDPIPIGDPGAKGAQPDDKVVIEMLRFPTHFMPGEAVLTKLLGPRGEPGVDTQSIIYEFGLPDEFPDEVLQAAATQAELFDETDLHGRRDLTKETIVTIDPVDARDFDDAISLSRSKDGHWHLGVHIADVSSFVQPGSKLDIEARKRGTSVYLPDRVLPMLPEVISNALASLQKGKVRYTKSAFIEFTGEGVPVHTEFVNSAIKVTRRFAYEDVLPIVQEPEKHRTSVPAKVRKLLAQMHELAMLLRSRRFAAGALELHLSEVKVELDKQGKVSGAREVVHDESHQMIEEFMLAANVAVATELADRGLPFLRRLHGEPDMLKLRAFGEFVTALGYELERYQSRRDLQDLLDRVKGEPAQHAVNFAFLRSLKQAEYSPLDMGHYALAEEQYCHFTSPIRRYPDMTIHRIFDAVVFAKGKKRPPHADEMELAKLGKHCSMTERRAAHAERELTKIKLLTYMADRIGEEMDAVITGVEHFGVFCQGVEIPVEGMVHISALDPDDYFYHDAATFSIIGRRTGKEYRLGDRVRVSIVHVDVDRRELDLRILSVVSKAPERKSAKKASSGRRSDDRNRGKKKRGDESSRGRSGSRRSGSKAETPQARKKKRPGKRERKRKKR